MESTATAIRRSGSTGWAGRVWSTSCRRPLRGALLSVALLLASTPGPSPAQSGASAVVINREYTIKAAFLYHFLTYTEWPDSAAGATGPLVVGVYQTDPFGEVLDKIASTKKVANRSIEVRRIASPAETQGCHLLFVPGAAAEGSLAGLLAATANHPVMLVGETAGFANQGGAAEFYLEGNRVRFAINTDVVEKQQLKVSSKLLSLAKIVTANPNSK